MCNVCIFFHQLNHPGPASSYITTANTRESCFKLQLPAVGCSIMGARLSYIANRGFLCFLKEHGAAPLNMDMNPFHYPRHRLLHSSSIIDRRGHLIYLVDHLQLVDRHSSSIIPQLLASKTSFIRPSHFFRVQPALYTLASYTSDTSLCTLTIHIPITRYSGRCITGARQAAKSRNLLCGLPSTIFLRDSYHSFRLTLRTRRPVWRSS
jgi:hypothetical protein